MTSATKEYEGDAGSPIPNFNTNLSLATVAPALGVPREKQPDYLDYDQGGRGTVVTMFANTGAAYLMGIAGGGLMGLKAGLSNTPSSRFKVKLNSVLNHCGTKGSKAGNFMGVVAVLFSLYEGAADNLELDRYIPGNMPASPAFAAFMTGVTYKAAAGPRVAALAGTVGLGAVGVTYLGYSILGIPYGSRGFMWF